MGSHLSRRLVPGHRPGDRVGTGCTICTADGNEYLDFSPGSRSTAPATAHPKVVAAISEQAGEDHPRAGRTATGTRCSSSSPRDSRRSRREHRHVLLHQLGSRGDRGRGEARPSGDATGKPNVIVMDGRFHGRTICTMAHDHVEDRLARRLPAAARGMFVTPFPARSSGASTRDRGRPRARGPSRPAARRRPRRTRPPRS